MRITFILPPLNMSGGVKVVAKYAGGLSRLGHTVRVVCPRPAPSLIQRMKSVLFGGAESGSENVPYFEEGLADLKVLKRSRKVLSQDVPDADVVVATWWETAEWVNDLRPEKGVKVYFVQHHEVFPYLPVDRCHATYRFPMHKVVVSAWLARVMAAQYDDKAVDIVPNAVDKAQFFAPVRTKQRLPTVGFLYSSVPFKDFQTTLAVVDIVRARVPGTRFVAFGSEQPTSGLPLPHGTEYFHSPPQEEIRHIYSRCDVWLTCSRSEGFNLPALEAMACRTPVVSTSTGWPQEAVKSFWNGVLLEAGDVSGLANGVIAVLSMQDADWQRMSANAYQTATSTSLQTAVMRFEAALFHACARSLRGEVAGQCSDEAAHFVMANDLSPPSEAVSTIN